jgi:catalase
MPQRSANKLVPFLLIGGVVVLSIAGFAWAGGWIGPSRIGGSALAGAIEKNSGTYPGYRRAHAKGLCFEGTFQANGSGASLSSAGVMAAGQYPVIGRFSTGGSNPFATDGRNVFHAMALQISGAHGQIWRMALDHTPIFPVATPKAFVALQRATTPLGSTGKPDPKVLGSYLAEHPETKAFQSYLDNEPLPDSFAGGTYHSINAFHFIDSAGRVSSVRWAMVPETPMVALDKSKLDSLPTDYLFNEILTRLGKGPVRWHMIVTIAQPGDRTDDATVQWPQNRPTVDVGILTITRAEPEETGPCRDITFDPTLLPAGVELSDDPLLPARSAAYSASFRMRALEGPEPSAIGKQLAAEQKGEK